MICIKFSRVADFVQARVKEFGDFRHLSFFWRRRSVQR
jgi:hypothetical protein